MNILEQVAAGSAHRFGHFSPTTTQEYFALRIAAKLDDAAAARHYVELLEEYSTGQILTAYARATFSRSDVAKRFHKELQLPRRPTEISSGRRLAVIRIDRRAVAVAIFAGDHLKHADGVQLSSVEEKASSTLVEFLSKTIARFTFEYAALETSPPDVRRARLHQETTKLLRNEGVGIAEVAKTDLLTAFSHPRLRSRRDLRNIIAAIYPVLQQVHGTPWTYDAAALGLYIQTERLLSIK